MMLGFDLGFALLALGTGRSAHTDEAADRVAPRPAPSVTGVSPAGQQQMIDEQGDHGLRGEPGPGPGQERA